MTARGTLAWLTTTLLLAGCGQATRSQAAAPKWPFATLELGLMDVEGGAQQLAASAPLKLRYHYLAGGINTSDPWTRWGRGEGRFVDDYVAESRTAGMVPVFTYYELRQSLPGSGIGDESEAINKNLRSTATMQAYLENLRVLFGHLGDVGGAAVVHVEPDLWGYVQQRHGDDARDAQAEIATTKVDGTEGLPNTVAGLAQAIKRMRDELAPNVTLGYGLSIWGTNKDIVVSNESDASVDELAARSVRFYQSLGARFDAIFGEFSDRTSGYAQNRSGAGSDAWWDSADFARHARFMRRIHEGTRRPIVLWQIPLGNTVMRSVDNSVRHYQDNRVQWLLSPAHRYRKLRAYRDAGVVALLFGPGQGDDTHASDDARDGVTNPSPVAGTGNRRVAKSADDDGGYFKERVRAYEKRGPLRLR